MQSPSLGAGGEPWSGANEEGQEWGQVGLPPLPRATRAVGGKGEEAGLRVGSVTPSEARHFTQLSSCVLKSAVKKKKKIE